MTLISMQFRSYLLEIALQCCVGITVLAEPQVVLKPSPALSFHWYCEDVVGFIFF